MEWYNKTGKMAIGSRLRQLSELVTQQAAPVYALYGIDLQPKWFPVFYALADGKARTITAIAAEIGHSHPSVSTIVGEMAGKKLVTERRGAEDGRKNFISLSPKGLLMRDAIQVQYQDVSSAVEQAMQESQYNLWKAIEEWEFLLQEKSLLQRVREARRQREAAAVTIVDYTTAYATVFKQLNEAWITENFVMEPEDHHTLDHPDEHILDTGGHILIALHQGKAVGTCALIRRNEQSFEMAKMAVAPEAKGLGIGWLLGQACVARAKAAGATSIYLESNTKLVPAISLYKKLGFVKVNGAPSPYERCNIQMQRLL